MTSVVADASSSPLSNVPFSFQSTQPFTCAVWPVSLVTVTVIEMESAIVAHSG